MIYFGTVSTILLIYSYTNASTTLLDSSSFGISFKIGKHESLLCFFKIILVIMCPLIFHMNFRIHLSISTREKADRDWFQSADQFEEQAS